jgi:hypothetical protein
MARKRAWAIGCRFVYQHGIVLCQKKIRPAVPEASEPFSSCADAPDIYERLDRFISKLSQDPRWDVSKVNEVTC